MTAETGNEPNGADGVFRVNSKHVCDMQAQVAPNLPVNLLHFVCDAVCEWFESLLPAGNSISSLTEACEVVVNRERTWIEAIHVYKHWKDEWSIGEWTRLPPELHEGNENEDKLIRLCEEGMNETIN